MRPVIRGATVLLIDDPAAGMKGILAFTADVAIYMQAPLADQEACREIPIATLREYFAGPARVLDPVISDLILAEIDRLSGN